MEQCQEEADEFLAASNLPCIEENIINNIYKKRGILLIDTLVSDLEKIVKMFLDTKIKTASAVLRKNREKMNELEQEIVKAKKTFADFDAKKNDYSIPEKKISEIFKCYKDKELMPKIKEIIEQQNATISGKDDFEELIRKLEEQVKITFRQYRGRLEGEIIGEQRKLFSGFQKEAKRQSAQFYEKLDKELDIDPDINGIDIKDLNVEIIVNNLNNKIEEIIDESQETHYHEEERKRETGSFCNRNVQRWIEKIPYQKIIKTLQKDKLSELVGEQVDGMNENAIKLTVSLVQRSVAQEINKSIEQFRKYANAYATTIRAELKQIDEGGTEYVRQRLEELSFIEQTVNEVLNAINKTKIFIDNERHN